MTPLPTRYYDLIDDMRTPGRWHLRRPVDAQGQALETAQFKEGRSLSLEELVHFPVNPAGVSLEFTLSSFAIPVVHPRVVALFERLGLQKEVQFIPAQVEGQPEPWFILNALRTLRCIDEARCEEVLHWLPEDHRPDKLGEYRNIRGLKVDPAQTEAAHNFRLWGWRVVLIISERVMHAMEAEGITGAEFIAV